MLGLYFTLPDVITEFISKSAQIFPALQSAQIVSALYLHQSFQSLEKHIYILSFQ